MTSSDPSARKGENTNFVAMGMVANGIKIGLSASIPSTSEHQTQICNRTNNCSKDIVEEAFEPRLRENGFLGQAASFTI